MRESLCREYSTTPTGKPRPFNSLPKLRELISGKGHQSGPNQKQTAPSSSDPHRGFICNELVTEVQAAVGELRGIVQERWVRSRVLSQG